MTIKLEPDLIEHIHDVLVGAFLPFDESVNPSERRDRGLIESAAGRPFQTAFGAEIWPTVAHKAAALFHSLACNHCFINGNKRTAVIGLDLFLAINMHLLVMTSEEVYEMATATAKANEEGREIGSVMTNLTDRISRSAIDIETLKEDNVKERLGSDYERIMIHVARVIAFGQRAVELSPLPND